MPSPTNIRFTNEPQRRSDIKRIDETCPSVQNLKESAMFTSVFKSVFPAGPAPVAGLVTRFTLALAARRQRQALARLDDAALRDIGLDRASAEAECRRVAWDVPAHWLK
jgi:uncharacterized protein YjiS (DUF1127 family)